MTKHLRHATRTLARNPSFSLAVILTMALGIGANAAIFSVFKTVLLTSPPFPDARRLVVLEERAHQVSEPVSYPNFRDWQRQARSFETLAAVRPANLAVVGPAQAERVPGKYVSHELFQTLGVRPALGREFTPGEDAPQANPVAILSHGFWERRFGADTGVLGQTLRVDEGQCTVVGVLPPGFRLFGEADVFLPLGPRAFIESRNDRSAITVIGRMRTGVGVAQARAEMETVAHALEREHPQANAGHTVQLIGLGEALAGWMRPVLVVLFAAVGLILLIACVNVANLMLARSTDRGREFALRAALGADRWQSGKLLMAESLLLCFAGGLVGVALAAAAVPSLVAVAPGDLTARGVRVDGWVVAFAGGISCLTALLFAFVPVLGISRPDLNAVLKESCRASEFGSSGRMRELLVTSEIAIALVLLIGAGLLVRSTWSALRADPGFRTGHVLTLRAMPSPERFMKSALAGGKIDLAAMSHDFSASLNVMLERVQAVPGVEAAAIAFPIPMANETSMLPVTPEGQPDSAQVASVLYYVVSEDYFRVMGIPLRSGRVFGRADDSAAPRMAMVNESMARKYWPGEGPVGKRFRLPRISEMSGWLTVVGVVGDTRHRAGDRATAPQFYMTFRQWPNAGFIVAKTVTEPMDAARAITRALAGFDREMPVYDVRPMEARLALSRQYRENVTLFLGIFASLAVVLTVVGVYGVMAYSVARRTHEIGVRMALGARNSQVLRMILRRSMTLGAMGAAAGVAASLALTRFLATLLFGVTSTDPLTFAAAALMLGAVAAGAGYVPARRAASLDPMRALRCS